MYMPTHRKTILVIHPPGHGPGHDTAAIRRLLGSLGHIAVSADGPRTALKALGTVHFDVIFTSIGKVQAGDGSLVQALRARAPGSAVVGIDEPDRDPAIRAWLDECDATVRAPLSASRVQWALDFELRYFGS